MLWELKIYARSSRSSWLWLPLNNTLRINFVLLSDSITLADSLFSEILSRKENADKTREALSLLTRHKFLFQLPSSIDRNIRRKEYDLVVNDYTRVKNLFGNTDIKVRVCIPLLYFEDIYFLLLIGWLIHKICFGQLFQKILIEIDKKIEDLKEKLHTRMKTMPINVQEQTNYIRYTFLLNRYYCNNICGNA